MALFRKKTVFDGSEPRRHQDGNVRSAGPPVSPDLAKSLLLGSFRVQRNGIGNQGGGPLPTSLLYSVKVVEGPKK